MNGNIRPLPPRAQRTDRRCYVGQPRRITGLMPGVAQLYTPRGPWEKFGMVTCVCRMGYNWRRGFLYCTWCHGRGKLPVE